MMRRIFKTIVRVAWLPQVRTTALLLAYGSVLTFCLWLAFQLRFDFDLPEWVRWNLLATCAFALGVKLICMICFHQFDGLLTYFSTPDLKRLGGASSRPLVRRTTPSTSEPHAHAPTSRFKSGVLK